MQSLRFIEVSAEAMESENNLDTAFSALFILVFLPIKDFWVVVCSVLFDMTVQLGGKKND